MLERIRFYLRIDQDAGRVYWKRVPRTRTDLLYKEAGSAGSKGYWYVKIDQFKIGRHVIIWANANDRMPEVDVHHRDGIPGHDWLNNLDELTRTENLLLSKTPKNNKSGVKGVGRSNGYWVAYRARKHLGSFKNLEDAIRARRAAE